MLMEVATCIQLLSLVVVGLSVMEEDQKPQANTCPARKGRDRMSYTDKDFPHKMPWDLPRSSSAQGRQNVPVMDQPMMLVENVEGTLRLKPDAVSVLRAIEVPVVVVALAGPARAGKSYLLNRLAGSTSGFPLGSSVQSHTKGIWIWCRPHPRRADQRLILLDTEGLGDPEKGDEQNDNAVLALAILLSSVFVYNSKGTIDQQSMRNLHFVTELAKRIQVNSQRNVTEERSFVQFFPDFVWTLRDLTLDLEIDGMPVTPDQYLENSLRLREGETDRNMDYNALRRCIRDYFPSRRCFAFVCPAARADLRNLQELPDERLDPEFVAEFRRFSEYIYVSGKAKSVPGGYRVTGKMLSQLVESYVAAIASGELPCVESGVAIMVEKENQDAIKKALGYYDQKLSAALEFPPHIVYRLSDMFTFYHNEAIRIFMDHSLMDHRGKYVGKLAEELQSRYQSVISDIERVSRSHCKEVLGNLQGFVVERLDTGEYLKPGGSSDLDDDLEKVVEEYNRRTSEEVKGVEVLAQFLKTVQPRLAEVQKVHSVLQEKVEQESVLRKQLAKAEEERKALEEREAADGRVRAEEVVRLAKRRYDEEKEWEVVEHTRVINHKRKEGKRYRDEGSQEDWQKNEEDSRYYEGQREKARSRSFWDQCREIFYRLYSWLFQ